MDSENPENEGKQDYKPTESRPPYAQRFNYGIIIDTDIEDENMQKELVDIVQIACEKFAAAEKSPKDRDSQAAAAMIKATVDKKLGGPFNVVVGEAFSVDINYIQHSFFHMYFGGYLGIYIWKSV